MACRDRQEAMHKIETLIHLGASECGLNPVRWDELVVDGSVTGASPRS